MRIVTLLLLVGFLSIPVSTSADDFISGMKANPEIARLLYTSCVSESGLKEYEISLFNHLKELSPELSVEQRRVASKNFSTIQCGRAVMNANEIGYKVTFGYVPVQNKEKSKEEQGALLVFLGCNGKENNLLALDKEMDCAP